MKKLFAILLAVMLFASMATVASAASTTTLTTTVPAASYTLNVPAECVIPFGETWFEIDEPTVTNASGFAVGKNLKVIVNYDAFTCANTTTTIPITLTAHYETEYASTTGTAANEEMASGDALIFKGNSMGTVWAPSNGNKNLTSLIVKSNSADWGKALAGEYTSTITYTTEVVVE